jgi:aspartyl-tRNA(Asn)/glutamyl-tRNA(Gln) amidotransferase subunit A
MTAEAASIHRPWLTGPRRADYAPTTLARMLPGLEVSAADYLDALRARAVEVDRFVNAALAEADLVHMPVLATPVPRIDETEIDGHPDWVAMINRLGWFMGPANYLGLPAIAVPVGFTANGLPNAMQLVGRPFDEATVLRAALAFERETGFPRQAPPT